MWLESKNNWLTKVEDGYLKVYKGAKLIAAGETVEKNRVINIAFAKPEYQKSNKTRQKAIDTMNQAGYK